MGEPDSKKSTTVRQHYFPAAVLGNFSFDRGRRGRESPVYVLRRGIDHVYTSAADKIAYRNDFYAPFDHNGAPNDVEEIWKGYENRLPSAIGRLVDGESAIDAATWTRILVPFVAAALVRAPEFRERFKMRMPWVEEAGIDADENAGNVIWIELQRVMPLIVASRWTVLRAALGTHFVQNDLGWFAGRLDGRNHPGVIVPVRPDAAIQVSPRSERTVFRARGFRWIAAEIETRQLTADETNELRQCAAEWARAEIYGPDADALEDLRGLVDRNSWWADLQHLGFQTGPALIPTEFDWWRLAALANCAPGTVPMEPPGLAWPLLGELPFKPPAIVPVNLPGRMTGIHISEHAVAMRLASGPFLVAPELPAHKAIFWFDLLDELYRAFGPTRLKAAQRCFKVQSSALEDLGGVPVEFRLHSSGP